MGNLLKVYNMRLELLDLMGEVARNAWDALDKQNAKTVYRQLDALSSSLQRAAEEIRKGVGEYARIADEEKTEIPSV